MIITLTGNLLAERTLGFSSWSAGKTQRAEKESFQVGGKGINVSKMLSRIGISTTAWCFAGGAAGAECANWLADQKFPRKIFSSSTGTRTGLVVRSPGSPETTFLAPDRSPSQEALEEMALALKGESKEISVLALCGSFPGWDSPAAEPLRIQLSEWAKKGKLMVDSYGAPLTWALTQPVSLVKINRMEFDSLFETGERSEPVLRRIETALGRWPVQSWIVTDGPGTICYGKVDTPPGSIQPPPVKEVSATGCGDVMFACVLAALCEHPAALRDAIEFAIPYAAANAAHPGIAEFDLNNPSLARSSSA